MLEFLHVFTQGVIKELKWMFLLIYEICYRSQMPSTAELSAPLKQKATDCIK